MNNTQEFNYFKVFVCIFLTCFMIPKKLWNHWSSWNEGGPLKDPRINKLNKKMQQVLLFYSICLI